MKVVIQRPTNLGGESRSTRDWESCLYDVELRPLIFSKNAFVLEKITDLRASAPRDQHELPILHRGYFDCHLHATWAGLRSMELELGGYKNWDELMVAIVGQAKNKKNFLRGYGWDESTFGLKLESFVKNLDAMIPNDLPIALFRVCGHSAYVNRLLRDKLGLAPDQALVTDQYLEKLYAFFGAPSVEDCEKAFLETQKSLLNYGITAIGEMSVDANMIQAFRNLCARGELLVDVQACFDAGKGGVVEAAGPLEIRNSVPIGPLDRAARFEVRHWKKYLDGSFGSRTAWLTRSYEDVESFGENLVSLPALLNEAKKALEKGFYLSFHVIGDAALDQALEVGERLRDLCEARILADRKSGASASMHRLEHAQLIRSDQLERISRQGLWALCVQPGHRLADTPFVQNRLGVQRLKDEAYRAGSFLDHSLAYGLSSDAPIDNMDPEYTLRAAMTHPSSLERLSFSEAVWSFTTGSRLALGLDPDSLRPGSTVFLSEHAALFP